MTLSTGYFFFSTNLNFDTNIKPKKWFWQNAVHSNENEWKCGTEKTVKYERKILVKGPKSGGFSIHESVYLHCSLSILLCNNHIWLLQGSETHTQLKRGETHWFKQSFQAERLFISLRFYGVACDQITWCLTINHVFVVCEDFHGFVTLFSCCWMLLTRPYWFHLHPNERDKQLMFSVHHVIASCNDERKGLGVLKFLFLPNIVHMLIDWRYILQ